MRKFTRENLHGPFFKNIESGLLSRGGSSLLHTIICYDVNGGKVMVCDVIGCYCDVIGCGDVSVLDKDVIGK